MNKNAAVLALCLLSAALGFGAGGASADVDADASITSPATPSAASTLVGATEAIPLQSSCGDHSCDAPEDCQSCPQDCGSCCGNNRCEPPEDHESCPQDC